MKKVDDWLEEIRQGIKRSFMGLDSTLDHYRDQTWYPRRFLRGAIGPWMSQDQPRLSQKLRHEVRRRIAAHDFALDPPGGRDRKDLPACLPGGSRTWLM